MMSLVPPPPILIQPASPPPSRVARRVRRSVAPRPTIIVEDEDEAHGKIYQELSTSTLGPDGRRPTTSGSELSPRSPAARMKTPFNGLAATWSAGVMQSINNVVINRKAFQRRWREGNIHDNFTWCEDDILGWGTFGKVFRGRSKRPGGRSVAVKQIPKSSTDDIDQLWAEIGILSELDHPNVLRLLEAYMDHKSIYIVTEVCLGGCLSEWLERVQGDARFARRVASEVVGVLAHCHSRGICHRDLKLNNILLIRDAVDSSIRVADFGLAAKCSKRILRQRLRWSRARATALASPSRAAPATPSGASRNWLSARTRREVRLQSFKGTPEYMAPEVIRLLDVQVRGQGGSADSSPYYDFRCDVWSLGVVIYILLTGGHPYTLENVSAFVVEGAPLPMIDHELRDEHPRAQHFLKQCLVPDFSSRRHAEELLNHPWLTGGSEPPAPSASYASDIMRRLRGYTALSEFKRAALMASVRHLGSYEHEELRTLFQKVDWNNVGTVTADKLRNTLECTDGEKGWIDEVTEKMDFDKSGQIDFSEFLAAVMDHKIEDRKDLAWAAFNCFDRDGDGLISKQELSYVLRCADVTNILESGIGDENGDIDFEEFQVLLRRG